MMILIWLAGLAPGKLVPLIPQIACLKEGTTRGPLGDLSIAALGRTLGPVSTFLFLSFKRILSSSISEGCIRGPM